MSSYAEGQTHQLVNALESAGFTANHLTKLGQFGNLEGIKKVLDGLAEITVRTHIIDCDTLPAPYNNWKVEEHRKGGQLAWDPTKVRLHLSPNQAEGKSIQGNKLRVELATEAVLNANVLDYLLANPHLIPQEWKQDEKGRTRYIFFWGTIYRDSGGYLYVRFLYWHDGRWQSDCIWLAYDWHVHDPSAVSAS